MVIPRSGTMYSFPSTSDTSRPPEPIVARGAPGRFSRIDANLALHHVPRRSALGVFRVKDLTPGDLDLVAVHQRRRLGAERNAVHLDGGVAAPTDHRLALGEIDHRLRPNAFIV